LLPVKGSVPVSPEPSKEGRQGKGGKMYCERDEFFFDEDWDEEEDYFFDKEAIEMACQVASLLEPQKLLQMKSFKKAVLEAARLTYQTGREAGFQIYPSKKGKIVVGEVILGGCDEITHYHTVGKVPPSEFPSVAGFHMHPSSEGCIIPSTSDLSGLCARFDFYRRKVPSLEVIGQVRKEKIDLLFIQATKALGVDAPFATDRFPPEMNEERQSEVIKALREAGFKVELVSLKFRGQ
jgi:hypothetical protein